MPRLLDLFCGAGGAAVGYAQAGFSAITGVDIVPQPHYPFDFLQADALEYLAAHGQAYDAIHASPPCQRYAPVTRWRGTPDAHPDLLQPTLTALQWYAVPWVVENVPGAPMPRALCLCGSMFGLPIKRHRLFAVSWPFFALLPVCTHRNLLPFAHKAERQYADAMGCPWMTKREAREAIPPAYTRYLGTHLLRRITDAAPV